jgi:uncharacterized protein
MGTDPGPQLVRDAPSFKVFKGGSPLPDDAVFDLMGVSVSQYVEGASTFTLTFNCRDFDKQEFKYLDDNLLAEGTEIEVKCGFADSLQSLIKGEVTALEPEYPDAESPTLKVHGYDRLHRFRRGRRTQSYVKVKDSDIAQQIAGKLGLSCTADDSSVTYDYVLQDNVSDVDFLLQRARRINYEVVVQDKTLYFRKTPFDRSGATVLAYGVTLRSFYPRLSTMGQVSEVVVQGWDAKNKAPVKGTATNSDVNPMGGQTLGVTISTKAFSKSSMLLAERPVLSAAEAQQAARGRLNEIALGFITGEGLAIGHPDIQAGRVVELKGLGRRFSGKYYVTSATHTVNQGGYSTRFTVARTAA